MRDDQFPTIDRCEGSYDDSEMMSDRASTKSKSIVDRFPSGFLPDDVRRQLVWAEIAQKRMAADWPTLLTDHFGEFVAYVEGEPTPFFSKDVFELDQRFAGRRYIRERIDRSQMPWG
jgi:hypothetical protein